MDDTTLNVHAACQTFITVKKKATELHFLWVEQFLASFPPYLHGRIQHTVLHIKSEAKCLKKAAFKDAVWY